MCSARPAAAHAHAHAAAAAASAYDASKSAYYQQAAAAYPHQAHAAPPQPAAAYDAAKPQYSTTPTYAQVGSCNCCKTRGNHTQPGVDKLTPQYST